MHTGNKEAGRAAKQAISMAAMTTTRLPYTNTTIPSRWLETLEWQKKQENY